MNAFLDTVNKGIQRVLGWSDEAMEAVEKFKNAAKKGEVPICNEIVAEIVSMDTATNK